MSSGIQKHVQVDPETGGVLPVVGRMRLGFVRDSQPGCRPARPEAGRTPSCATDGGL